MEFQGESLEEQVGVLLRQKGIKLALAESCTGGLVSHWVTNIPGSSDYYLGGVAAYAYEAKERLLGVKHETLLAYGAVSRETALEMARGARLAFGADISAAVTGIAGPGGGMPHKPVGLVWIALSAPGGEWAYRYVFNGNRIENKTASAHQVLRLLVDYLTGKL
jgi:PncC family amidohydrolase